MHDEPLKILLVEDEPLWQEGIRALVSTVPQGGSVEVADNFETALSLFEEISPDVVLLDWKIKGDKDGLAVGEALEAKGFPPGRMILVSGSHPSLIPENPYHFVPKPMIASQLTDMIERVTKN